MKKKLFLLSLIFVALLCFAACGHKHSYGDWVTVTEAGCESSGFLTRTCSECGEVENVRPAPLGHDEAILEGVAETCDTNGMTEGKYCTRCNIILVEQKDIYSTGHDVVITARVEPTCQKEGTTESRICSRCNKVFAEALPIEKVDHKAVTVVGKAPTCTEGGLSDGSKCSMCNKTIIEQKTLPALGHNYVRTVMVAATSSQSGTYSFKCSTCGKSYTEKYTLSKLTSEQIAAKAAKAVGTISVYDIKNNEISTLNCFAISSDGKIITSYVAMEYAYSAKITLNGKTYTDIKVCDFDLSNDLVLLKINANNLTYLPVCSEKAVTGNTVYTYSYSSVVGEAFTEGIISYAYREIGGTSFLQHDAAVSARSSGSPVLNEYGEVIGVNSFYITNAQNLNLATASKYIGELSSSSAMSFEAYHQKQRDIAQGALAVWMANNGFVGSDTIDYMEASPMGAITFTYSRKTGALTISCTNVYSSGVKCYWEINFGNKNGVYKYRSSIKYPSYSTVEATGLFPSASYTLGSGVAIGTYDGPSGLRDDVKALNDSAFAVLIGWMDKLLYENMGITMAYFGFGLFWM
ncbi:MAG: trypsin-like peptidase domain-containing protein [Clostridia bacterium]|nr:trypsin-like peptidase domain-containing protein [Clostridia bacterium]